MIDRATHLAAMIRAQFAAQFQARATNQPSATQQAGQRAAKAARSAEPSLGAPSGKAPAPANDEERIQQMVAQRVRSLSPDDSQRQRKAFRLFLESVLIQTFGRDRLDDRGFDQMVDTVLQRMENDPQLDAALREAGDQLLADAGSAAASEAPPRR